MTAEARAVFATRADVPRTADGGVETALLLAPADTAGRSAAQEITGDPGASVSIDDDMAHRYVFVVAGAWALTVGGEERACAAGTMIQLPAGIPAVARVTGDERGTLLVVALPSGTKATL